MVKSTEKWEEREMSVQQREWEKDMDSSGRNNLKEIEMINNDNNRVDVQRYYFEEK